MVKVAIIGVGNCASALVQGVEYYKRHDSKAFGFLPEIKEVKLKDIKFVLGFDVNKNKVGKDLSNAIFVEPNCTNKIYSVQKLNAPVFRGPVLDGLDSNIIQHIPVNKNTAVVSIKDALKKHQVDVVVILLPTGSQKAAEFYANEAIAAGCGVMNGMPALIANNREIVKIAEKNNLPLIGDDVKSQIGATIVHRALSHLFPMRGAILDKTIQLDWGGDMDFCNLMSNKRYEKGKRQSKTESVIFDLPNKKNIDVQISAVDYIPFLKNQKEAYIRIEGRIFGNQSVRIDATMQVQDAYNSAGILLDGIRVCAIARRRKIGGVINSASSFFNKKPPIQLSDDVAKKNLIDFLNSKRKD
jgi:myo-inositol-1-phosphate synthase